MNYKKLTLSELTDLNKLIGEKIVITGQIVESQTKKQKQENLIVLLNLKIVHNCPAFIFWEKIMNHFLLFLLKGKK